MRQPRRIHGWRWLCLLLLLGGLPTQPAQTAEKDLVLELGENKLILGAPLLAGMLRSPEEESPESPAWFNGTYEGQRAAVGVLVLDRKEWTINEPDQVMNVMLAAYQDPELEGDPAFHWSESETVPGKYGHASFGTLARAMLPTDEGAKQEFFLFCGILETHAYCVQFLVESAIPEAKRAALRDRIIKNIKAEDLMSLGNRTNKNTYMQAASLIEFLRDGKFHADKFPDFVRRMGTTAAGRTDLVESVLKELYETDIDGLHTAWLKYWKKK